MFERFVPESRQVLVRAQEIAKQHDSRYIRRHHMLLGILDGAGSSPVTTAALENADVDVEAFRAALESSLAATDERGDGGTAQFTREAKQSLELALREALTLGHNYIADYHLLLAILRDADGPLADVVAMTKLTRAQVGNVVAEQAPDVRERRRKTRQVRVAEAVRGRLARRSSPALRAALEATYARAVDRDATTGDLLVALLDGTGTHFAAALKDVSLPDAAMVAAEVDRLVEANTPDGTDASVSVDPDTGAVTLQDPVVLDEFKRLTQAGVPANDALIRALRRAR